MGTQNICYGYSKEPSQCDGSFKQLKNMFKLMRDLKEDIFFSLLYRDLPRPLVAMSIDGSNFSSSF